MGGFSYDRNDYDDSSSSGWGSSSSYSTSSSYSAKADKKMGASCLDKKMRADKRVKSNSKNPIVICLDVTGSNIDFAKIVYDKMPMFYGQIEEQGYLDDFDICFMACGDANSDSYPLQVCNFEKGVKIDEWLESIVLESGGGGQKKETYEMAAYYMLNNMDFEPGARPIIFFLGDEGYYSNVDVALMERKTGYEEPDSNEKKEDHDSLQVFKDLRKKCDDNVFMMLSPYESYLGAYVGKDIRDQWERTMAEGHVIPVNEDKAIIDLLLGVIALVSQTRTLDTYKIDMGNRDQTQARISTVGKSLDNLSTALAVVNVSAPALTAEKKTASRGKRL